MDKAEKAMLEEVALRNAIAMFRRKNAAAKKRASIPKVGIFWVDAKGRMYAEGVDLRGAEDYGDFKIYEKPHFDAWDAAVAKNRQWEGMEYEDVPRGRVVYQKHPTKPTFIVYMPKQAAKMKGKVLSWFGIPSGSAKFDFSDEHYRMAASSPYGRCPVCGRDGVSRERRPNGNDKCESGHSYPSRDAIGA